MPLPLILGIGAAIAGVVGAGNGIHGGVKLKKARDTMKIADERHQQNLLKFGTQSKITNNLLDELGKKELAILNGFERFSNTFEKIQNRPIIKSYSQNGITIPEYDEEELKNVSVGASILLGGIGGAAAGTAGGFAAAGATTAAVMALGTASTGTAIASLSGIAATNATLAALGGGAIAAGGGGVALGSTVLGVATLGVGLLIGGIVFNITGSGLSNKADKAWEQMKTAESEIDRICEYLKNLTAMSKKFYDSIMLIDDVYQKNFDELYKIICIYGKTDWDLFTPEEKLIAENTSLLVGLLYNMCKVKLVLKAENNNETNKVNYCDIDNAIYQSKQFLNEKNFAV